MKYFLNFLIFLNLIILTNIFVINKSNAENTLFSTDDKINQLLKKDYKIIHVFDKTIYLQKNKDLKICTTSIQNATDGKNLEYSIQKLFQMNLSFTNLKLSKEEVKKLSIDELIILMRQTSLENKERLPKLLEFLKKDVFIFTSCFSP